MSEKLFETYMFGISHKVAAVDLRDKASFTPADIPAALELLNGRFHFAESLILSTCNRTEIYAIAEAGRITRREFETFFREQKPQISEDELQKFYFENGPDAIRHLFRVVSGVESMILGEPQIQGQVKDAHKIAFNAHASGNFLNKLFNMAVVVGKRVRTETDLCKGAVSVAFAAVELAEKIFKDLSNKRVLLIGSGETGTLVARNLQDKGVSQITITNRTASKAQNLARELNGLSMDFAAFKKALPLFDVIIGSTGAPHTVLNAKDLAETQHMRRSRPLILIDIAAPRDFDPDINELENLFLYNIDDLQNIISLNLEMRRKELPQVEKIIKEEIAHYFEWKTQLRVTPTIVALREKLEDIRHAELEKMLSKLSDDEKEHVERITRGIVNKILHEPMIHLRAFTNGNTDGYMKVDVVRELFGLDKDEKS